MPPTALSTGPLVRGLVDDAALFPPGNAPMAEGLAEHARYRAEPWSAAVGPFLCPASRMAELAVRVRAEPPSRDPGLRGLQVALVNDVTDGDALNARRLALRMGGLAWMESRYDRLGEDPEAVGGGTGRRAGSIFTYLEVPRSDFGPTLDLIEREDQWQAAKYRTGGVTPDAYPDEAELATFLLACVARGLPFKLTAGLHRAARNTSPEGFEQHGVLNVLVAVRHALDGESASDVEKVLALRDAETLTDAVRGWSDDEASGVRTLFRSFGCCGVTDPLGDLAALGLLEDYR
jgi:hypothetical protein